MLMNTLFALFEGALSPSHIIIVLIVGVLLFGRRLPEIGRSLGKGLVEFKKGLHGLEDELHGATTTNPARPEAAVPQQIQAPQRVAPPTTAPKFNVEPTQTPPQP
jgi:sec-independent protein translocase protein TatA